MILHFVTDEKFIDMAYRGFEAVAPGRNRFIIISKARPLRYIRSTPVDFFLMNECRRLLREGDYDAVCLHGLHAGYNVLPAVRPEKKVFWFGWGSDYYGGPLAPPDSARNLLLPETQALMGYAGLQANTSLVLLARIWAKKALRWRERFSRSVLQRIDYFSPVLDTEYHMVSERNPWFRAEHVRWNYGTVEDDLLIGGTVPPSIGQDILLGNSAAPPNNHLEAFNWLARHPGLGERRVIVPLGYGMKRYKAAILAAGRERLGDRFVPLTEFMPINEYFETLSRCGFVFMNHLRQQAVGTVVIMLLAGAKVFLHPQNPLYAWLGQRGAAVFDIGLLQQQSTAGQQVFDPLQENEKQQNRSVAKAHWGREVQRAKTTRLVELIYQRRGSG